MITGEDHVLPKLPRDDALKALEDLEVNFINEARNRQNRLGLLDVSEFHIIFVSSNFNTINAMNMAIMLNAFFYKLEMICIFLSEGTG